MTDRRLRVIQGGAEFAAEVLRLLDGPTIEIRFGDSNPPWRRQTLGITLVDLLGRLFPRIRIEGIDAVAADPLLPPGPPTLTERLEEARSHGIGPMPPGESAIVVNIGDAGFDADLFCDADGWQSYLGPSSSGLLGPGDQSVAIGSVVAACRAAARVFALLLEPILGPPRTALEPAYASALTYEASAEPLNPPTLPPPNALRAALAGAGSVGGAAAFAWALTPDLAGSIEVIDCQALQPHNPDRALLATQQACSDGLAKVEVVARALTHHTQLEVAPHSMSLDEWVASRPREQGLPLMLCAFDSLEARRQLQDSLALEVINAACGDDDIAISGHRTGDGPCLYCLHIGDVLDTEQITFKLIVEATALPSGTVQGLLENHVKLTPYHLHQIEDNRGLERGKLASFTGNELTELYEAALRYGEAAIERDNDQAAVAAPFVTALAGALLAGEALKASQAAFEAYRLGPRHPGRTKYQEEVLGSALNAMVTQVERWQGTECLCQSARRQRLLRERYELNGR